MLKSFTISLLNSDTVSGGYFYDTHAKLSSLRKLISHIKIFGIPKFQERKINRTKLDNIKIYHNHVADTPRNEDDRLKNAVLNKKTYRISYYTYLNNKRFSDNCIIPRILLEKNCM